MPPGKNYFRKISAKQLLATKRVVAKQKRYKEKRPKKQKKRKETNKQTNHTHKANNGKRKHRTDSTRKAKVKFLLQLSNWFLSLPAKRATLKKKTKTTQVQTKATRQKSLKKAFSPNVSSATAQRLLCQHLSLAWALRRRSWAWSFSAFVGSGQLPTSLLWFLPPKKTSFLATDSNRNQLPSLVSSARNSFRFLIHSHFHLRMFFFSYFFFFWFFYSCCYCRFLHYRLLRNFMPFCGLPLSSSGLDCFLCCGGKHISGLCAMK